MGEGLKKMLTENHLYCFMGLLPCCFTAVLNMKKFGDFSNAAILAGVGKTSYSKDGHLPEFCRMFGLQRNLNEGLSNSTKLNSCAEITTRNATKINPHNKTHILAQTQS